MKVYDVVSIVEPSADCSYRRGRHLVYSFSPICCSGLADAERSAYAFAETCRNCCHIPGVSYEVEEHDELSPKRAHEERDCRAEERQPCAGAKWE